MIARDFRIWRTDIEIACAGTSSMRGEPALADLLAPAGLVERDDEVGLLGVEIGGRIVEGEVAVLADADERDVDRRRTRSPADLVGDLPRLVLAVEEVVRARCPSVANQPLEEVAAEACGMIERQADVLVEMEHLDARPVDARRGNQRFEKLESARRRSPQ